MYPDRLMHQNGQMTNRSTLYTWFLLLTPQQIPAAHQVHVLLFISRNDNSDINIEYIHKIDMSIK